jgi:hypothetical protein
MEKRKVNVLRLTRTLTLVSIIPEKPLRGYSPCPMLVDPPERYFKNTGTLLQALLDSLSQGSLAKGLRTLCRSLMKGYGARIGTSGAG